MTTSTRHQSQLKKLSATMTISTHKLAADPAEGDHKDKIMFEMSRLDAETILSKIDAVLS